jgi:hypothetical protein
MYKKLMSELSYSHLLLYYSFLKSGTKKYLFSHARCRNSLLPYCAKVGKDNFTFSHFMQGLIVKKINSLNPHFLKIKKFIEFRSLTAGDQNTIRNLCS